MSARAAFFWKVAGVALFAITAAAAFTAYLQPGMQNEFANLVLCY